MKQEQDNPQFTISSQSKKDLSIHRCIICQDKTEADEGINTLQNSKPVLKGNHQVRIYHNGHSITLTQFQHL